MTLLALLACTAPSDPAPPRDDRDGGVEIVPPAPASGDSGSDSAADSGADSAADSAADSGDTGTPADDESDWWFGRDAVHTVDLTIDAESWEALVRDPHHYTAATVAVEGVDLGVVGIHLKGSSSFEPIGAKPNIKIKFSWEQDGLVLHGEKRIELHNFHHDAARAAEYTSSYWLRAQGIPAPRYGYAMVTVNGEDYGLYGVSEAFDERYIRRWFPDDPDGNLYSHPYGVYCDLDTFDCLERNETGTVDDHSDVDLLNATANLPDDVLLDALLALFDRERLDEYLAAERVLGHWDSFSGNSNNYYLYWKPSTGQWQILLSSLDTAWAGLWGGEYDGGSRSFYGCGDFRPDPDDHYDRSLLASLCVHDDDCIGGVAARTAELADGLEASDTVAEANALLDWLEPMVLADPKRNMDDETHAAAVACFREWLPGRPDGARHWLARREEGALVSTDAATYAAHAPITVSFDHLQGDSDDTISLTDTRNGAVVAWQYPDGTQEGGTRHVYAGSVTFPDGLSPGAYAAEVRFENRPNPIVTSTFRVQ